MTSPRLSASTQVTTGNRLLPTSNFTPITFSSCESDVRFGSKADMCSAQAHVRFTPESDIKCDIVECPLWANSGHRSLRSAQREKPGHCLGLVQRESQ